MKTSFKKLLVLAVSTQLFFSCADKSNKKTEGESLFNGKDLTGWSQ
jgi:hypothetical protein